MKNVLKPPMRWTTYSSFSFHYKQCTPTFRDGVRFRFKSSTSKNSSSRISSQNGGERSSKSFRFNPLNWYSKKLETHPYTTKCITSGCISGGGDLLCQYIVYKRKQKSSLSSSSSFFRPDWYRTGRFGILGFALVAPVVHLWYGALMTRFPGTSITTTLKRTFVDQAVFAPIFLPTFMTNLMLLEGKRTTEEIIPELKRNYPDALVSNWALWIPAMLINFRFVPSKYQVLYSNMVGFVWNTYLSWKTQDAGKEVNEEEEELNKKE